jgi:hypothetical protein
MICGLFFILSANTHIIPGLNKFKTSEKINEVIPIAPNNLHYNDKNKIFILFLENENQPLTLIMNNAAIYHRLKADFLDKKIQVQRKKGSNLKTKKKRILLKKKFHYLKKEHPKNKKGNLILDF